VQLLRRPYRGAAKAGLIVFTGSQGGACYWDRPTVHTMWTRTSSVAKATASRRTCAKCWGWRRAGSPGLVSFFTDMLQDWNAFIQALLSGVVVFDATDPDRAKGRWFVQETGQRAEGANLSVAGVYHDEYVRDPGRSDAAIARWFTSLVYLYYFR
jgi:hypothetical protein